MCFLPKTVTKEPACEPLALRGETGHGRGRGKATLPQPSQGSSQGQQQTGGQAGEDPGEAMVFFFLVCINVDAYPRSKL